MAYQPFFRVRIAVPTRSFILRGCLIIAKKILINEEIRASEVRVIGADGNQLGILKTSAALRMANEQGYDLVEIAAEAAPPVCRIMDYGKFRFEKEKKEKENRKKQQIAELKELQLTCSIGDHDFDTKVNHANRFLGDGNRVKIVVKFKGREMAHTERGSALMERFAEAVNELGAIEKPAKLDGRNMIMILAPKKASPKKEKSEKTDNTSTKG